MRIIVDFENPGSLSYSVYKFENYNGYSGPVYVVAAGIGDDKAYQGSDGPTLYVGGAKQIHLKKSQFHGFNRDQIIESVKNELERIEQRKKTEMYIANNSQYGAIGVDPYKDQAQAQPKKFEDMSNGLDILDRAAKSQVKAWVQVTSDASNITLSSSERESAIPTKLFTVSKPKQTKTIRKVIPMKSNLKFKR